MTFKTPIFDIISKIAFLAVVCGPLFSCLKQDAPKTQDASETAVSELQLSSRSERASNIQARSLARNPASLPFKKSIVISSLIKKTSDFNQEGNYGEKGVFSPSNYPGARASAFSWSGPEGKFWIFGGHCYDASGFLGRCNDLWVYDPKVKQWAWMKGNKVGESPGYYGTKNMGEPNNNPGARRRGSYAKDQDGNFWLFGGLMVDGSLSEGQGNDLWKFDGKDWTWVSGESITNSRPFFGQKGKFHSKNRIGGRSQALMWFDLKGDLWIFGGKGLDREGKVGVLNDLWKFNGEHWSWMGGSQLRNQKGNYGSLNERDDENWPGARQGPGVWIDKDGNTYLFGGSGFDSSGVKDNLNDLWKWDGENMIWVGGSDLALDEGSFGNHNEFSESFWPSARHGFSYWTDDEGNFWIFAGQSEMGQRPGDDLWKFDGQKWGLMKGSPQNPGASTNWISPREQMSWVFAGNNQIYLFGGIARGNSNNDFWKLTF